MRKSRPAAGCSSGRAKTCISQSRSAIKWRAPDRNYGMFVSKLFARTIVPSLVLMRKVLGYNDHSPKRGLCEPHPRTIVIVAAMISIFTPSFADEADTNAQNLTVKEIVARMSPQKFHVTMLHEGLPDPRIANRPNTRLIRCGKRGTTPRVMWHLLRKIPDVYFFPRSGPLDSSFLAVRRRLRLKTALVTYIVSGGLYNPEPPPAAWCATRERPIWFLRTAIT